MRNAITIEPDVFYAPQSNAGWKYTVGPFDWSERRPLHLVRNRALATPSQLVDVIEVLLSLPR